MFSALLLMTVAGLTQDAKPDLVVILVEGNYRVRPASGRPVRAAIAADERIIRLAPLSEPAAAARLTGVAVGSTKVTLTDVDGHVEAFAVEVKSNRINLVVGSTRVLQLTSKKPIRRVINERDAVVRVTPVFDDPTRVMITGISVGRARMTLAGDDGEEEVIELGKPARCR